MSTETSGDELSAETSTGDAAGGQTTAPPATAPAVPANGTSKATPVRRSNKARSTASPPRKVRAKPAASAAKAGSARAGAGKQAVPRKKTATSAAGAKRRTRPSGKSSTAWSTSKMLKDITARLDLSRRQLSAAMDDLTALISRQIEAATAPLPRLVKGEWKTPAALGRLAGKLGLAGKEPPRKRKRPAAAKTTAKAAGGPVARNKATGPARKPPLRKPAGRGGRAGKPDQGT